jgi:predicted MPP superfamily phosphohydrolase
VSALILTVAVDAFFIEPRVLEVNRAQLVSPKLKRPLRIAVVADIQTDEIGAYEREALRRVAEEKPDLLLFAGDYLQEYDPSRRGTLIHQLRSALVESGLADHPAAFAVQGNCDADDWEESFGNTRIARVAETTDIRGPEFHLTALSMRDSFDTRLSVPESNQFHIVLGHSPDFALGSIQADLLIAGHTHGGQVRLPLIGPLITLSRIPRSWAAGVTELPGGRTLVVARGVGMERGIAPRLRFLCRPEVVIVEVAPSEVR